MNLPVLQRNMMLSPNVIKLTFRN